MLFVVQRPCSPVGANRHLTTIRISQRAGMLQPTAVNSILDDVREYQQQGKHPISLMRGEPDLATPSHIVDAGVGALAGGRTTYPNNQGELELRNAVARKIQRQQGIEYSPEKEILITSGATFGIYAALQSVLDPGDEVLLPDPLYDAYRSVITLVGAISRTVPTAIVDGRFSIDPKAFAAACGMRTRALLLNTPWNPTGCVLRQDELSDLLKVAEERDLIVISDEIYEALVHDGHRHLSPATISEDARRRTIVVNSFSKTYAMTGWRLGYCSGPAEWIRAMYLVLQQSSRGPTTFVQDAGVAALDGPQECVDQMRRQYSARRRQVSDALSGLPGVDVLDPEGGFFAMLDIRQLGADSDDVRRYLLNNFGVVVAHGAAYGPSAEGTLRVSFASGGDNLRLGLEQLRAGLAAFA